MANKLQKYILDAQSDRHNTNSSNFNAAKYNNIKLVMDESIRYPHIIIRIGMSEATYELKDKNRVEGGLGPDEKFVRKWFDYSTVLKDLEEIYKTFRANLTSGLRKREESSDYAIEVDAKGKIRRVYEAKAAVINTKKMKKTENIADIKKELKDYLKSVKRYFG